MKTYLLIETKDDNATFVAMDNNKRYFEIFQIKAEKVLKSDGIITEAYNQQEALKKFRLLNPNLNLLKRASKNFHETILIF